MLYKEETLKTFKIDKELYTIVKVWHTSISEPFIRINTPPNSFGYIDKIRLNYDIFKKPYLEGYQRWHKSKVLKRCKEELLKLQVL